MSVYYGAADTVVCLAHGRLSEVLDFVRSLTARADRPLVLGRARIRERPDVSALTCP